jgi:15-cis-phytoene synthase
MLSVLKEEGAKVSIQITHWEHPLLAMAIEALESHEAEERTLASSDLALQIAYRICEQVTRVHSRTFFMASSLLPPEKRQATWALYAFCRTSDDLVDANRGDASAELEAWRLLTTHSTHNSQDSVALAWQDTRQRYQIPRRYAEQLINGVARDLEPARYESFSELARYCYGVACTVGLMSMHIIGYSGKEAIPYAIRLGVALQLTNILRDVAEDWHNGRLYLPLDELQSFGIREEDLAESTASGTYSNRWRAFMMAQIQRNRDLYAEAMPGIGMLDPDGRFAIAAAAELYRGILDDIEAHDYNVFTRRASLSSGEKLRRLPGIWWRAQRGSYQLPRRRTALV